VKKISNVKFYENPSSQSRVVPAGWTDVTRLTVAFRNFTSAPKEFPVSEEIKLVTIHAISQEFFRIQSFNIVIVCACDMK